MVQGILFKMMESERWEDKFGAINASCEFISALPTGPETRSMFLTKFDTLYVDPEFRVRNQVGELLKVIF